MINPKKLIEVALPLDDINIACAYEKMPGIGPHPRGLHLWWARRPLAAARAVLFAQMVNDPGYERHLGRGVNKIEAAKERERLFGIIRRLVKWKNTTNETVLEEAREEIRKSWRETCALNKDHPRAVELFNPDKLPAFHDPFAGGGAIPLEAQRLGLESYASDLNPVAVLINKAMIEIPPKFEGHKPVGPISKDEKQATACEDWSGSRGLAEDVRRYGTWMRDEAFKRIGYLYPKVRVTSEMTKERPHLKGLEDKDLTVIAWLWARTVKSPNPVHSNVDVPLASTFMLSNKHGKEVYVEPVIENGNYRFTVKVGKPKNEEAAKNGTKSGGSHSAFLCLMSGTPMPFEYLRAEGKAGRMGARLMAIVAEGKRGRVYLPSTEVMEAVARQARPEWKPDTPLNGKCRVNVSLYGFDVFGDLFTPRQIVALTTFSDLVGEARTKVIADAKAAGMVDDGKGLNDEGIGVTAYADALALYLGFVVDRCADFSNSCTRWVSSNQKVMNLFGKQAIAMTWDFPEAAILHQTVGGFTPAAEFIAECIGKLSKNGCGVANQQNAMTSDISLKKVVSTDPPYYDNIGYADLSDFFYVWLRRSLKQIFPDLFATLSVPKAEELVATPYRHGNKEKAETFFLDGMTRAMHQLASQSHPAFPVTIYYAFKQSDTEGIGTSSTGWETFLEAVLKAGFSIAGTWPMRSEQEYRMIGMGANALASSIVLVCRKRSEDAATISRKQFLRELEEVLPDALEDMIGGKEGASPIAPVDLAQAAIGPGMAVFSKYAAILEADGTPMTVHTALVLINKAIDEYFTHAESDMGADTRFCVDWFQQYGFKQGPFGEADVLARAKGTSVEGVVEAQVIEAGSGKVRLLRVAEYPADWDPLTDKRMPVWEACHHMCRALQTSESAAGALLARMPEKAESIRQLAYRLYTLCERKKWAEDAGLYNALIISWHAIVEASRDVGHKGEQLNLV